MNRFIVTLFLLFCCNVINAQTNYQITKEKLTVGYYNKSPFIGSYVYTIKNKSEQNLFLFFIAETNDTLASVKLLRKKLYCRYGKDFYLAMIEWDPNMIIMNNGTVYPETFVKVVSIKEQFKISIPFANSEEENIASNISRHLLICPESMFATDEIGMPNFLYNLKNYNCYCHDKKVVITASKLKSFIQNYVRKKNENKNK